MVRLTDRADMTIDVYRGRKTTIQQQQQAKKKKKKKKPNVIKILSFGVICSCCKCNLNHLKICIKSELKEIYSSEIFSK